MVLLPSVPGSAGTSRSTGSAWDSTARKALPCSSTPSGIYSHANIDLLLLEMPYEGPRQDKEERQAYPHEPVGRIPRRQRADRVSDQCVQDVCGQRICAERAEDSGLQRQPIADPNHSTIEGHTPARAKDLVRGTACPLAHGPQIRTS